MHKYLLLIVFIARQHFCVAQEVHHSYDDVIKRFSENTWWYDKWCEDDTCYSTIETPNYLDRPYFYAQDQFSFNDMPTWMAAYHTTRACLCIVPAAIVRYKDRMGDTVRERIINDLIPDICFIDSNVTRSTYQILTVGEDGFYKAELFFTTDSQFYIRRIDTSRNKQTVQKRYFSLRGKK